MSENEEAPNSKEDDAIASTIPITEDPTLTKDDILAMNIKELKAEPKKQNLKISGNKQTLQVRLQEAVKNNVPIGTPVSDSVTVSKEDKGNKTPNGIPTGRILEIIAS